MTLRRRRASAVLLVMLVLALIAELLSATGPASAARVDGKPPPNPSDSQLNSAKQEKANLAAEVGRLGAAVVRMQNQINQLQADAELAEQKYADAVDKLHKAKDAAVAAQKAVASAATRVRAAQREYNTIASSAYMSGSIAGTTGSLLTAQDPSVVLQQSAMEQYESEHQLDAVGTLKRATIAKSNADAAARTAVLNQQAATTAANLAKERAIQAVQSAQAQEKQLRATLAANQHSLSVAQERLATLNHQRATYIKWKKHQAYLRRQRRLARERAERAARRAARIAARKAARSGGHVPSNGPAPRPMGGSWSQAKGNTAVARARQYLGWMYAWAGGNASGPTFGVCAGDGAWNDCHVRGFDCSGLTLYAWAPSISMAHYAASQYTQAGHYHPTIGALRPGDLVFWSSNGTIGGIHHVAIYIGGGNVIQAPESGSVIQITPLNAVGWGYFGATRPLS